MYISTKIISREGVRVIANISRFSFFECGKAAVKHKNKHSVNKLIDLQGFFNKIIVRFSFINIFAFC